ncbi:hypothetical protein [Thaumasiovibrio sp. DFM-14]|uniref:hypothetical protein n=1 Tax=Thaumasiovibrio sp. DFM-14 TaxID=3384792 RepID=UPI0039A1CBDA
MKSFVVLLSAILWTIGRYKTMPAQQWKSRHWLYKGAALSFAIIPALLLAQWPEFIANIARQGRNAVILAEISMHLFLIVIAIQGLIGMVFIHIAQKKPS